VKTHIPISISICLLVSLPAFAGSWTKQTVTQNWTWVENYVFASAKYRIACEPTRECEVGTGIFAFGEPRGRTMRFSGEQEISVIGFGSIHIRSIDGRGAAQAAFLLEDVGLIGPVTVLRW
jgi:hypothetical protein